MLFQILVAGDIGRHVLGRARRHGEIVAPIAFQAPGVELVQRTRRAELRVEFLEAGEGRDLLSAHHDALVAWTARFRLTFADPDDSGVTRVVDFDAIAAGTAQG